MKLYLAPMESVTGYVFRNAFHHYYGGSDRYFTPFLTGRKFSAREKNDILPEHNKGMNTVPQILTNKSDDFVYMAHRLREYYGYEEVNLNLGCPSGTVVAKNRGAGMLGNLTGLNRFLDEIYSKSDIGISIKTRTGLDNSEDWEKILEIYNEYPLTELIVHSRCRKDFYEGTIRYDDFRKALDISRHSLCFNGDIKTVQDYRDNVSRFPEAGKIMCGRGIIRNPGLFGEIQGKEPGSLAVMKNFIKEIYTGYRSIMSGDRDVLFKMKELWFYFSVNFEHPEKVIRMIRKTQSCIEYEAAVNSIFRGNTV